MKTKIAALIAHLSSLPNASEGLNPVIFYKTAKTFNVPGRIVKELFLGNSRKLAPGKYAVKMADGATISIKPSKIIKVSKRSLTISNSEPAEDTSIFMYIATPEEISKY